ncbi:MAG: hypothetical protein AMXMBFR59_37190 [Rhodanobacteraceae bacterium]
MRQLQWMGFCCAVAAVVCPAPAVAAGMGFPEPVQLINPEPAASDQFGTSIAAWGSRLVVGAALDSPSAGTRAGSVYVYEKAPGGWWLTATLRPSDAAPNDWFGSVAVDGDRIIVGASRKHGFIGAVYVFRRETDGSWTQIQKLGPDAPTTQCGDADGFCHLFGTYVAIEGDRLVASAHTESARRGAIYVFRYDTASGLWQREARLLASDGAVNQQFGWRVRIADGRIVAGAIAGAASRGSAYVFSRSGGQWVEEARLTAADGAVGDDFGAATDMAAGRVVIGAYRANVAGQAHRGAAYVFERQTTGAWIQVAKLVASDGVPGIPGGDGDQFGTAVHLRGDNIYVSRYPGRFSVPAASAQGAVYEFRQTAPGTWTETMHFAPASASPGDGFGYQIQSHRDTVAVSAPFEGSPPGEVPDRGSVYVYDVSPDDRIFADGFGSG